MKSSPFSLVPFLLLFAVLMAGSCISSRQGKKAKSGIFILTGTIKDYSPTDSSGDFGKLFFEQALSGQIAVKAFEITNKGTFRISIPLDSPREFNLNIGLSYYPVWGIPGGKQHMAFSSSASCSYKGDGAEVSDALSFCLRHRDCFQYPEFDFPQGSDSLTALKEQFTKVIERNMKAVDSLRIARRWSDETATIIDYNMKLIAGCIALQSLSPITNKQLPPLPPRYSRLILEELPLNQKEAEALSYYHSVMHNINMLSTFQRMHNDITDTIITIRYTFLTYLLEQKVPLTEEERKVAESHLPLLGRHLSTPNFTDSVKLLMTNEIYIPFNNKYEEYAKAFREKIDKDVAAGTHPLNILISTYDKNLPSLNRHWDAQQAMFRQVYPHPNSYAENLFMYRFFIEQWKEILSDQTARIDTSLLLQHCSASVTLPEVRKAMASTLQTPPSRQDSLLHAESLKTLRRLVKPYAGKYVLLDFWGTTCAPCVYEMKRFAKLRKSYLDSPDFAYIFLTDQRASNFPDYQKYLSDQLKDEISLWLSSRDAAYLAELFAIKMIPRYILLDRDGNIIDRNFSIYMITDFLKEKKVRKKAETQSENEKM